MSLTSFWCPNYYIQTHFTSCSSIFSVSIVNFEQVKSQLGRWSHRSKRRDIFLFLFVKKVEKRKKNVVRGELKTCNTSRMDLFAKIVYCSKSLTILTYFPYSHVYSLHSHSHPIPRVPTLIRRISLIQFPILASTDSFLSLYSLRIYFRKIVALVQK